jgi:hypothetical protein
MSRPGRIPAGRGVTVSAFSRDDAFDLLPLFAADEAIGAMLLGSGREQERRQIVTLLEARGFPKIDHLMGGRYVRAVIDFFDNQYGLNRGRASPLAPDGVEDFEKWRRRQKRHS